jgi:hypothetical protein
LHHSAREAGLLRKREPMKKEGFKRVRQDLKSRSVYFKHGNRKKEKEKNFRKFLEVQKRFLPLQSQRKRREKQKR